MPQRPGNRSPRHLAFLSLSSHTAIGQTWCKVKDALIIPAPDSCRVGCMVDDETDGKAGVITGLNESLKSAPGAFLFYPL
jgi:hypothetical protein